MARALARRGHEVSVYTTNYTGAGDLDVAFDTPVATDDVTIRYYPVRFPRYWGTSPPLGSALRRAIPEAELVHLHSLYMYHDRAAGNAAIAAGVPYIVRPHGTLDPYIRKRHRFRKAVFEWWFQNRILEHAAALHYTSEDERRLATPYARNPRGFVVPNGIDLDAFEGLPPRGSFRAQHPEIGDRPIVLFLGRLNFKKGLDLLVPAFGAVRSAGIDAHLVIAGPDDGMAGKTRGWLAAAGALEHATFTGMLTGAEKLAAFADAAVFALPSYSENFGIAVVEAMACGLPVVISDAINIWPAIEGAGAGLVSPCDFEAVAANLKTLLSRPVRAAAMGDKGRALVRERYSWDGIAPALEAAYERVLGENALAARKAAG